MARLSVDGSKSIYFEDHGGEGQALLMIHGWGMDNRCWDGVVCGGVADDGGARPRGSHRSGLSCKLQSRILQRN